MRQIKNGGFAYEKQYLPVAKSWIIEIHTAGLRTLARGRLPTEEH